MLTILGPGGRLCDGLTRRAFLRAGTLGTLGLAGPVGTAAPPSGGFGRAKRCVVLFLTGGPPQHETFDPKPDAPESIRGEFRTIPTALPGVRFGELCGRLAKVADKLCVVRSVTHADATHTSAGYTML